MPVFSFTDMEETLFLRPGRLHYFVREVFKRLRVPPKDASKVADMMVAAELAGVDSEGVARLRFHVERLESGLVNPAPNVRIVHQSPGTVTMDGDNGIGAVVATAAMELAITKATRQGIAAVAVRGSNDFGMAGYYARMALSRQMIGLAMSNAIPLVVPPGATRACYGANPMAIAIPAAENKAPFVLDMTTAAATKAKIEKALQDKQSIPEGWALDPSGRPTRDPEAALQALRLLPLGSRPETGAYKGYGLGMGVEILCGVLSGGSFGQELSGAEGSKPAVAKIGHFFAALRIRAYGPYVNFRNRIDVLLHKLTSRKGPGEAARVHYPGEPELETERERRASGIPIPPRVATRLHGIATALELEEAWDHLLEARK